MRPGGAIAFRGEYLPWCNCCYHGWQGNGSPGFALARSPSGYGELFRFIVDFWFAMPRLGIRVTRLDLLRSGW